MNLQSITKCRSSLPFILLLFIGLVSHRVSGQISKPAIDFSNYSRYEIRQYLINIDDGSQANLLALKARKKMVSGITLTTVGTGILATGLIIGVPKLSRDYQNTAYHNPRVEAGPNIVMGLVFSSPFLITGINNLVKSRKYLDKAIATYPD